MSKPHRCDAVHKDVYVVKNVIYNRIACPECDVPVCEHTVILCGDCGTEFIGIVCPVCEERKLRKKTSILARRSIHG